MRIYLGLSNKITRPLDKYCSADSGQIVESLAEALSAEGATGLTRLRSGSLCFRVPALLLTQPGESRALFAVSMGVIRSGIEDGKVTLQYRLAFGRFVLTMTVLFGLLVAIVTGFHASRDAWLAIAATWAGLVGGSCFFALIQFGDFLCESLLNAMTAKPLG